MSWSTSSARRLSRIHSVADARRAARRALPPMVFDFVDGGAEDERTVRGNEAAFDRWWLRPRILEDVATRDQSVTLLGRTLPSPLLCAPAGLAGLIWPHGEAAAARAANGQGLPFVLSTASSCSIEDTKRAAAGPLWFQLYLWRDRQVTQQLVERAEAAGYDALCLTVDVPLSGQRERDLRNGMTIPPKVGLHNAIGVLSRPRWMARAATHKVTFANVADDAKGTGTVALGTYVNSQLNPSASWDDLRWLRATWRGSLVVKGVLDPAAAKRLVDEGVDAVVVSNHGGRQLDGAIPALVALPEIAAAVGHRVPVLLDGGVRRGTDVVKAIALGASACLVGRPYLWGLAVAGEEGVSHVLSLLRAEIDRTLALACVPVLRDVVGRGEELLSPAFADGGLTPAGSSIIYANE